MPASGHSLRINSVPGPTFVRCCSNSDQIGIVLEELLARVGAGMEHDLPVPFYFIVDRRFYRELL